MHGQAVKPGPLWLWWESLQDCCFTGLITALFPWLIVALAFLFLLLFSSFLFLSIFLFFFDYYFCIASFLFLLFSALPTSIASLLSLGPVQSSLFPVAPPPSLAEWCMSGSLWRHFRPNVIATQCSQACSFWCFLSVPLPSSFSFLSSINHLSVLCFLSVSFPMLYLFRFTSSPSPNPFLYRVYNFSLLWLMLKRILPLFLSTLCLFLTLHELSILI